MVYNIYKFTHKLAKSMINNLPISDSKKAFISAKLSGMFPIKKVLQKAEIPNPIKFQEISLFYRDKDIGDLGIVNCLLRGEYYEPEVVRIIKEKVVPEEIFIDCGAHIGYHSIIAARMVGIKGKVFAFEPFDESYKLLKRNIALNRLQGIIVPIKKAVWSSKTTLKLIVPPQSSVSVKECKSFDTEGLTRSNVKFIEVEAVSLDDFISQQKVSRVDWIKLDIEGAEREAFIGARYLIRNNEKIRIICEFNYNNLKKLSIKPLEFFEPLLSEGIRNWYILYPQKEKPISIPSELERLVSIAKYKNLNLLGMR